MTTPSSQSAKKYQENAILTASPGKLIQMLLDGTLKFVRNAEAGFSESNISKRNETINNNILRAQAIVSELQSNLNMQAGGEFAETMFKLYDFLHQKLQEANLNKIPEPLVDVQKILNEINDAWAEMLKNSEAPSRN